MFFFNVFKYDQALYHIYSWSLYWITKGALGWLHSLRLFGLGPDCYALSYPGLAAFATHRPPPGATHIKSLTGSGFLLANGAEFSLFLQAGV